jgi:AraC family transcriptional regulator of adaptative response/methylated-DNA-[protein]-cysteine methyltransferase
MFVGATLHIGYGLYESPFGLLLMACTSRGVCYVGIGADEPALAAALEKRYTQVPIVRDESMVKRWAALLQRYLREGEVLPCIPLDIKGTPFQERVWRALQAIPPGSTRSYGEIARQAGSPGASRAVGQACGANPVLVLVPCHRVVRKNGALGGFGGGLSLKVALLAWEQAMYG